MKKNNVIILAGLYLYSVFSIMGISGMSIAAGITILGIIISCFIDKNKVVLFTDNKNKKMIEIIFLYFLWRLIISTFFSPKLQISLSRFTVELLEFSLLFGVLNIYGVNLKMKLLYLMILVATLQSVYGIVQYFTGIDIMHGGYIEAYDRIKGTLSHWNTLGGLLGMIVPIIFAKMIYENRLKFKMLYVITFVLCFVALIFTKTRGAWIGCYVGILVISIIHFRIKAAIIFLVPVLISLLPPVKEKIVQTIKDPTFSGRTELWQMSIDMMKSFRIITGYGIDGFEIVTKRFHPHNIYLNNFNDAGIIGVLLLIIFFILLLRYTWKTFKIYKDTPIAWVYLGILGTFVDFIIHGLVDNIMRCETAFLFWFLIGVVFSLKRDYLNSYVKSNKIEIYL